MDHNELDIPFDPEEQTLGEVIKETYAKVNKLSDKQDVLERKLSKIENSMSFSKGVMAAVGFAFGMIGAMITLFVDWLRH